MFFYKSFEWKKRRVKKVQKKEPVRVLLKNDLKGCSASIEGNEGDKFFGDNAEEALARLVRAKQKALNINIYEQF